MTYKSYGRIAHVLLGTGTAVAGIRNKAICLLDLRKLRYLSKQHKLTLNVVDPDSLGVWPLFCNSTHLIVLRYLMPSFYSLSSSVKGVRKIKLP